MGVLVARRGGVPIHWALVRLGDVLALAFAAPERKKTCRMPTGPLRERCDHRYRPWSATPGKGRFMAAPKLCLAALALVAPLAGAGCATRPPGLAHAPDLSPLAGAPANARARLYAGCVAQAASTGRYDRTARGGRACCASAASARRRARSSPSWAHGARVGMRNGWRAGGCGVPPPVSSATSSGSTIAHGQGVRLPLRHYTERRRFPGRRRCLNARLLSAATAR